MANSEIWNGKSLSYIQFRVLSPYPDNDSLVDSVKDVVWHASLLTHTQIQLYYYYKISLEVATFLSMRIMLREQGVNE